MNSNPSRYNFLEKPHTDVALGTLKTEFIAELIALSAGFNGDFFALLLSEVSIWRKLLWLQGNIGRPVDIYHKLSQKVAVLAAIKNFLLDDQDGSNLKEDLLMFLHGILGIVGVWILSGPQQEDKNEIKKGMRTLFQVKEYLWTICWDDLMETGNSLVRELRTDSSFLRKAKEFPSGINRIKHSIDILADANNGNVIDYVDRFTQELRTLLKLADQGEYIAPSKDDKWLNEDPTDLLTLALLFNWYLRVRPIDEDMWKSCKLC